MVKSIYANDFFKRQCSLAYETASTNLKRQQNVNAERILRNLVFSLYETEFEKYCSQLKQLWQLNDDVAVVASKFRNRRM